MNPLPLPVLFAIVSVVAVAALYFVFIRKKDEAQ
jgi:hypothetical protein